MRVLQVYRDHFIDLPGGIERHVYDIARGLAQKNAVEMVSSAARARSSKQIGQVLVHVEREYGRPGGVPLAPGIFSRVRDGYDLVHIHSPNPTAELACWSIAFRTPTVATYHADVTRGSRVYPAYTRFLRTMLAGCDRVIIASERLIASSMVLKELAAKPKKLEIVPFGIDTQHFSPNDALGGQKEGALPTVLFVGRLRYYKGLPYLIEAMAGLEARLVVVGDGEGRHKIEAQAKARLGDRFKLIGRASEQELVDLYRSADVFCLPSTSRAEAFGISTLEAMACGIPVVTTELGTATSEINEEGVTGRVVPPQDVDALTESLEQILQDDELRAKMSKAARARAVDHYDRNTMLLRIGKIYESVHRERAQ